MDYGSLDLPVAARAADEGGVEAGPGGEGAAEDAHSLRPGGHAVVRRLRQEFEQAELNLLEPSV